MTNGSEHVEVDYAEAGTRHESFQHIVMTTDLPYDTLVASMRRAIEAEDMIVFNEVDVQDILSQYGYAIEPVRQLLYFHPRYMARLLAADPAAVLEAPLKYSVIAGESGSTSVRYQDAGLSFARYGNDALSELGRELADLSRRVVDSAMGGSTS